MIEFLLLITALTLLYILLPIVSIYAFVKALVKWELKKIKILFYRSALAIDQFGNVISSELFNDIMITKDGYKFGKVDETISSVIGKNKRQGTLSALGMFLDSILDRIDPNHSINSIEEDE